MKTIKNTDCIRVLGTTFADIREAIGYALQGKPKDGVYVGEDSMGYPCFDAEDYASEDRSYWNVVFASSQEELTAKLEKLQAVPERCNHNRFTEALAPMAYWEGDTHNDVAVTDDIRRPAPWERLLRRVAPRLKD